MNTITGAEWRRAIGTGLWLEFQTQKSVEESWPLEEVMEKRLQRGYHMW